MKTTWVGIQSDHQLAVAHEMRMAIDAFDRLGAQEARARCEERRKWLLTQLDAPWLQPHYGPGFDRNVALKELGPPFPPFIRPNVLIVRFVAHAHPGSPAAPMWVWADTRMLDVFADAIGPHPLLGLSSNESSVRQITFHELLHVHGDAQHDGIARYNWAGAGALVRATSNPPRPVAINDGHPPAG